MGWAWAPAVTEKIYKRASVELTTPDGHVLKISGLTLSECERIGQLIDAILRGRP